MRKNKNKNTGSFDVPVIPAREATHRKFLKIGEIAHAYGILPSTVNYYTREGLLIAAARSRGGYRLYQREKTLEQLRRIDHLQNERRLTIAEIKKIIH